MIRAKKDLQNTLLSPVPVSQVRDWMYGSMSFKQEGSTCIAENNLSINLTH